MKKVLRKRTWLNIVMSIIMAVLSVFSVCSSVFMFDYKNKLEKQEEMNNQQKDENTLLQKEKDSLQTEIGQLEQDKIDLKEAQIVLQKEKEDLIEQKEELISERDVLKAQVNTVTASETQLKQEKASLENTISDLNASVEELEEEKKTLKSSETELKAEKQSLESQLENANNEKNALQKEYDEYVGASGEEKQQMQAEINSLDTQLKDLQQDYDAVVESEELLKQQNEDLNLKIEQLTSEKETLLADYNKVVASETKLKEEKASLNEQIEKIEEEKSALQDEYDALVIKEAQLQKDYDQTKAELDQLKEKYNALLASLPQQEQLLSDAGRVVLMLGDGLNDEVIENAEIRLNDQLYVQSFANKGSVQLSEGQNAEDSYGSLVQEAKSRGLGVAYVTTDSLIQDTAKKFTAPNASEGDVDAIFNEQIASDFDLIFGVDYYNETAYTYSSQKATIEGAGYKFIDNLNYKTVNKYYNGNLEGSYALEAEKLFGVFVKARDSEFSAIQDNAKTIKEPCLGQMTEVAIKYMDLNFPCGYLLIIENDQIDDYVQEDNEVGAATAVVELDRCAKIVRKSFNDRKLNYNLIVTGDDDISNNVPYFIDGVSCELEKTTDASKIAQFACASMKDGTEEVVEKVVMAIGDGMGTMHIACAQGYLDDGEYLNMERFSYSGVADAASLTTGKAADSAAGGTALATGVRVENGYISMDSEGNNITTIAEIYKSKGMGVGIISTDYLFEATPASFYAHTNSRWNFTDIRTQQYACGFDLFLGADMYSEKFIADENGFYSEYSQPSELPEDYVEPQLTTGYVYALEQQKIKDAGYTYFTDMGAAKVDMNATKLFGAFPAISQSTFDAPLGSAPVNTAPSFAQMVALAIDWMELHYGDKGYFLMIEENYIDINSELHNDDGAILSYETGAAMNSLFELDRALAVVKEKLEDTGDNYAIVVSADHSTGGFAESTNRDNNFGFWTSYHDSGNIPYFIELKCPKSANADIPTQLYIDGAYSPILNTEINAFVKTLADKIA